MKNDKKRNQKYKKITNHPGIATIWDWNSGKGQFVQRNSGLRYYAYRRWRGRQVSKCFLSLAEAKKWRYSPELENENASGCEMDFKELLEKFFDHASKNRGLRASTLETYRKNAVLLRYFYGHSVQDITPRSIDDWLKYLRSSIILESVKSTRTSFRKELKMLRLILTYYAEYLSDDYSLPLKKRHLEDAVIDRHRFNKSKSRNSSRYLSEKELDAFLSQLEKGTARDRMNRMFYLLALFQARTGLRISEAAAVHWEDIDFKSKEVLIRRRVFWPRVKGSIPVLESITKNSEDRIVFLSPDLEEGLRNWLKELDSSCLHRKEWITGLVFFAKGDINLPLTYRSIQYQYDKALTEIKSDWRSTHILRHSFATDWLSKGLGKEALQGILGHRTSSQTDHYAKITDDLKRKQARAYGNVVSLRGKSLLGDAG